MPRCSIAPAESDTAVSGSVATSLRGPGSHAAEGPATESLFSTSALFAGLIAWLILLCGPMLVSAQVTKPKGPEKETVKGKLSTVEKKGKTAKITVDRDGGDPLEIMLTPKMALQIEGSGDKELLRQNVVVSTEAFTSNNNLFASEFIVHHGIIPPAAVIPDPQDPERFKLTGSITGVEPECLVVNFGARGVRRVMFDSAANITVKVISSDVNYLVEGSEVELEGIQRGTKFLPSAVKVTHKDPFKAEELFANQKTAKTKTPPEPKTAAKKTKPGLKEAPGGAAAGSEDDPFGVMKKDTKPAPKGKTTKPEPAPKAEPTEKAEPKSETKDN